MKVKGIFTQHDVRITSNNFFSAARCRKKKEMSFGATAAQEAARQGDKKTLHAALDAGCGIDSEDFVGMTPLMYAANNDHMDCLQLLLQRGANVQKRFVNKLTNEEPTAAHFAALQGHLGALRVLLAAGVDLLAHHQGWSIADSAGYWSHISCLSVAVACGDCLRVSCEGGCSRLVLPVVHGFYSVPAL